MLLRQTNDRLTVRSKLVPWRSEGRMRDSRARTVVTISLTEGGSFADMVKLKGNKDVVENISNVISHADFDCWLTS